MILAARPKTLPAAIVPVLLGAALGIEARVFDLAPVMFCLIFALLIQIGTNYANDYFDFVKGADTPDRIGPLRAVAGGLVKPRQMFWAMTVVFALAFAVGCGLIYYGGWWLLAVGIVSIICGIAYTGGPYPLGYNGFGDILVFIFFGIVAVMFTFFVQSGYFSLESFWVSLSAGGLITNILVVNNYRDVEQDARADKKTLVVRFGRSFALRHYQANLLLALVAPIILWQSGMAVWVFLPLIIWPFSLRLSRGLRIARSGSEFNKLLAQTAGFLLGYGVLFSVGIALA